jgi:hypothetical protein
MTNWLDFINSIPGLAKAMNELVGDVGRLGSSLAKLGSSKVDESRRAIEDRTSSNSALSQAQVESEVAIIKALSDAAVKHIHTNELDFGERALSHGIHNLMKLQNNREMVVLRTAENLRRDLPSPPSAETPSQDWLNLFGRYAENASSEKLREHWAHILEGEIRKPGTFSFVTLQLASLLDERLARIIESFRPWVMEQCVIPLIDPVKEGSRYSDLIMLASINFVSMADHVIHIDDPDKPYEPIEILLDGGTVLVPPRSPVKIGDVEFPNRVSFPSAVLTPAALELLSALPPVKQDDRLPKVLRAYLEKEGFADITIKAKDANQNH